LAPQWLSLTVPVNDVEPAQDIVAASRTAATKRNPLRISFPPLCGLSGAASDRLDDTATALPLLLREWQGRRGTPANQI
jgi:hypothetical protein